MKVFWLKLFAIFILVCSPCFLLAATPVASHLQTELATDPAAVGTDSPRLSWWGQEARTGASQSAYEVQVWQLDGTDTVQKAPVWSSGQVHSTEQLVTIPAGLLKARAQYAWHVRLWDELNWQGRWSAPGKFGVGMLHPSDWDGAEWIAYRDEGRWRREWAQRKAEEFEKYRTTELTPVITSAHMTSWQLLDSVTPRYDPSPLLRKRFEIEAPIREAYLYISGLGYGVEWVNGRRLDAAVLDPGWTSFQKDVLYRTFDVTHDLQHGENVIGVMLGRGFYGMLANDRWGFSQHAPWIDQPTVKALLLIEYQDGHRTEIRTDTSWKVSGGPVLYDDPWLGEIYDARQEHGGWLNNGYDESTWKPARLVTGPSGSLRPQTMPPVRPVATIIPVSTKEVSPGVWLIDLGVDIAGWMRITVQGHPGDRMLVQMAEKPDPVTFIDKTTNNFQQFGYVLKGGAEETAESHFSYMGFRYVKVTASGSVGAMPRLQAAVGVVVHTDVGSAGSWTSSDPLLNSINAVWRRTQLNNMTSIPTDCPGREKLGWMADSFIAQPAAMYSFGSAAFYENFAVDLAGTQDTKGLMSTIAPSFGYTEGASPLWASAEVWIPWKLYLYTDDIEVLRKQYPHIKQFLDATLQNNTTSARPYILEDVLGDWDSPGHENPPEGNEPYSTAYYFLNCRLAARMAKILGNESDANELDQRATNVGQAFNKWFYSPESQSYHGFKPAGYRQSINALALSADLVPAESRTAVYANLRRDVLAHGDHLNTGIIGTGPLLETLADMGDVNLVYRLINQTTYPSWGYMLKQGATTMWESWDGHDSQDHPMQGTVVAFLYRYLAGIRIDETHPGFSRFFIEPIFPKGLHEVKAVYASARGPITSEWTRNGMTTSFHIVVPFNTTAVLSLPEDGASTCSVKEGERSLWSSHGHAVEKRASGEPPIEIDLPSGNHVIHMQCEE
jgi:alpha-L-rhamnosidase